ncbi:hypothetical protein TrST_g12238 [Triparma strigata]|uniref:Uncharacterized protein n=1 Tax=Triparma strigata TaxID=1606541 RepID=A0A9W7EN49_9STRA|nr:hypothetical protein TrST_g12238 [Triparma strigata]
MPAAAEPPSLVSPLDASNDDFASIDHSSVAAYVFPMMLDSIRKSTISALEGVQQQTSQPPSQKKRKRLDDMYETVAKLTVRNQFLQAGASASMITRVPLGDVLKVFKEEKDDGGDGEDYSELLNPPPPPYLHPYDNAQLATALRMARAAEENARKALDPRRQIEERKKKELVEAYKIGGITTELYQKDNNDVLVVRLHTKAFGKEGKCYYVAFDLVELERESRIVGYVKKTKSKPKEKENSDDSSDEGSDDDDDDGVTVERVVCLRLVQSTLPDHVNVDEIAGESFGEDGMCKVQDAKDLKKRLNACTFQLLKAAQAHENRCAAGARLVAWLKEKSYTVVEESINSHNGIWDTVQIKLPKRGGSGGANAKSYWDLRLCYSDVRRGLPTSVVVERIGAGAGEKVVGEGEGGFASLFKTMTIDKAMQEFFNV